MEQILSNQPVIPKKSRVQTSKELKVVTNFIQKLKNVKNSLRLLTCEFDEQLLQLPGLIGALTPRLEAGWQSFSLGPGSAATDHLANDITHQLLPCIKPVKSGQHGLTGPVPLSHTFTWTRLSPRLECTETVDADTAVSKQEYRIILDSVVEPEVVILLTTEQIKGLTKCIGNGNIAQNFNLNSFGTTLKQLNRPVTCILFTGAQLRTSAKKRSSGVGSKPPPSINQLCAELQIRWGVRATRVCSTIHDVALVLASYHRSVGERPFKEGRLSRDEGLAFLPDTVRKGLAGCASRGRGAGPAPPNLSGNDNAETDLLAAQTWANRIWLAQLGQWRGLTGEIANAISQVYPTALSFFNACHQSTDPVTSVGVPQQQDNQTNRKRRHPLEVTLSDLEIRRGAGLLSSRRRLGPEFARRLVTHFTSEDPNQIIE